MTSLQLPTGVLYERSGRLRSTSNPSTPKPRSRSALQINLDVWRTRREESRGR